MFKNMIKSFVVNALIFLFLLYIAKFNPELLSHYIFHDDSFYYFKIAENFINGYGVSFSGVTNTTGFHPLWLWILILITKITEFLVNENAAIFASLLCSFVIMNGVIYVSRTLFDKVIQNKNIIENYILFMVLMLWRYIYDGMESGVVILIVLLAIASLNSEKFLSASIFIGLLAFARVDIYIVALFTIFLFVLVGVTKIIDLKEAGLSVNPLKNKDTYLCLLIMLSLGFARNYIMADQVSSKVKIFWFQLGLESNGIIYVVIDSAKNLISSCAQILWPFQFINPFWFANSNELMPKYLKLFFGLCVILIFIYFLFVIKRMLKEKKVIKYLGYIFLIFCSFEFLIAHSIVGSMSANWQWYLAFPALTFAICSIIVIDNVYFKNSKSISSYYLNFKNGYVLFVITLIIVSRFLFSIFNIDKTQFRYLYIDIVKSIDDNHMNNAVIGTWAAGHIGYFHKGKIINLEGLVESPDVFQATISDDISNIVEKYNIKYILAKSTYLEVNSAVNDAKNGQKMSRSNQRNRVFKDLKYDLVFERNISCDVNYSLININ